MPTAARSNRVTTAAIFRPLDQNGEPEPPEVSDDGPAAAAIVVVVEEVVEVLEVLEVELVDVDRCVVVVLRCVVVVRGVWVVVVGAGAAVVVVVGATVVVVVEAVVVVVSSAPAGPTPMQNTAIMSSSTAPPRAATEARRGVDGRITSLTLDRRCLLTRSAIRRVRRLPLMLRAGIGGSATNGTSQKHRSIGRADAPSMAGILEIAHMRSAPPTEYAQRRAHRFPQ
jgi:hypothetical protein